MANPSGWQAGPRLSLHFRCWMFCVPPFFLQLPGAPDLIQREQLVFDRFLFNRVALQLNAR